MRFFGVLPKVSRGLAAAWWGLLLLRGALPAVLAVAIGSLVGAVRAGSPLAGPLAFVGVVFVVIQVLAPLHAEVGSNLGERTSSWLNDQLLGATLGIGTIAVVVALGPLVDLTSRLLRLDVHQGERDGSGGELAGDADRS